MKKIILLTFTILLPYLSISQTSYTAKYYNVSTAGSIKFWGGSNHYRIVMYNTSDYRYGPVQDYSIKTTMYRSSSNPNRGWTWGEDGKTPVIAMRTDGTMQIAKDFSAIGKVNIGTSTNGEKLNIVGGNVDVNDGSYFLRNSSGNTYGIGYATEGGSELTIFSDNTIDFTESDGNVSIMRINGNAGKVGIGTTAPSDKLDVNGSVRIRSLSSDNALTQVVVVDANGKLHYRDASTISGGTGTDDQKIDELSFSGTNLSISLEGDGEATRVVDLVGLQDGYEANTDHQDLVLSGNTLSLTNDATSVDLSAYLDNTDAQTLSLNGSILSLTTGGDVDLSSFADLNDNQTATEVTYDNLTSGLTASNAKDALDELAEKVYWEETALGEFTIANGKVGINTASIPNNDIPALGKYELAVGGEIIAEEVNVLLQADWPDYVFEESYDLQSLQETEKYISKNKHLPNVPSAQEVKEKGVNLGQMNATLLRQIEELTLHLINQNKQIEALIDRVEELESK